MQLIILEVSLYNFKFITLQHREHISFIKISMQGRLLRKPRKIVAQYIPLAFYRILYCTVLGVIAPAKAIHSDMAGLKCPPVNLANNKRHPK